MYDKLELKHQIFFYKLIESIIKKCHGVKQNAKYVPLVKQNVMKLKVFILGRQRIDQKRKKGWEGEGEVRGLRKGAAIEIERKETKGN